MKDASNESTLLARSLGAWGAYAAARRARVLWGAFIFTLLMLPLAWRALSHLDVNLFNQASDSLKRFRLMRELSEEFMADILAAVVTIPDKPSPQQVKELKSFGALLAAELAKAGTLPEDRSKLSADLQRQLPEGEPWLRHIECRTGQGIEQALKKIARDRPYVLWTVEEIERLKKLFEPQALSAALERVAAELEDLPPNSAEKLKLQEDPLGVLDLATAAMKERLAARRQALSATDPDGYFLSPDGTTLAILARAVLPANRLDFNRALMAAVQRAENSAVEAFRAAKPELSTALKGRTYGKLAHGEKPGALAVGFTGISAVAVENEMSLKYDLILNTVTSLLGVLLLFYIGFRSLMLTWDVTWTTVGVIIWTLAFAGATRGSISLLGGAFTAVPVGLGTDYTILLYNTYHRLRETEGLSAEEAMRQTLMRSGPSIITAALITSLAFFGVGFSHLTGLAEFGILGGTSALLGCAMMLLVFPAALSRPRGQALRKPLGMGVPAWGRVLESRGARAACLLAGALVLAATAGVIKWGPDPGPETVAGVRFDPELGNLRSLRIQAIPLRTHLAEKFGMALADVRVMVEAATEEQAFAGAEEAARRMTPFIASGELTAGGSLLDFVPSPARQQASMAALKSFDFEAASDAFKTAAQTRFGEKGIIFFKPFLKRLQDFGLLTRESTPLTLASVMQGPLANLLAAYVKLDSQEPGAKSQVPTTRVRLVSSWFPAQRGQSAADRRQALNMPAAWYDRIAAALENNPPPGVKIHVTAARMVGFELKESTLRDCVWITAIVGACVAVSLVLALRSLKSCLLATIPLIFAYAFMLAGVPLSQMMGWDFSLNFVNLLMFPLLLGSAIDYGVYLVFEAYSERRPGTAELVSHTGLSVCYCMGTTLIGFGSFVTSSYTGLISMGIASLYGYAGALFGALVVLPALLGMLRERGLERSET